MYSFRRARRSALAILAATCLLGLGAIEGGAAIEPLGTPTLKASSDTGRLNDDRVTNDQTPTIVATGSTGADSAALKLLVDDVEVAVTKATVADVVELTPTTNVAEGDRVFKVQRGTEDPTAGVSVKIDITAPTTAPTAAPDLQAASDSFGAGTAGTDADNLTNDQTPTFDVPTDIPVDELDADRVELVRNGSSVAPQLFGTPATDGTVTPVPSGTTVLGATYAYGARFVDLAGNGGAVGPTLNVTVRTEAFTIGPAPAFPALILGDTGRSTTDRYTAADLGAAFGNLRGVGMMINGARPGAGLVWERTDPAGTTINLTPAPPNSLGIMVSPPQTVNASGGVTGILGAFHADVMGLSTQLPMNGGWTYRLTQSLPDVAGNFSAHLRIVIDTTAPQLPSIDLRASSDSGSSNTDNVTRWDAKNASNVCPTTVPPSNCELVLDILTENDTFIDLYRDGTQVGAQQLTGGGQIPDPNPGVVIPTSLNTFTDASAFSLSAWHGYSAVATDRAGNTSSGGLPVFVDVDNPVAPLQLDLIAEDDHGSATDDNVTNLPRPRFQVNGAEDGAKVELTACEGPGCTLLITLQPLFQVPTRTTPIGETVGNGIIQPIDQWWTKTPSAGPFGTPPDWQQYYQRVKILENYTAGNGPVFWGNPANTSWRFSVRQTDLSGRMSVTGTTVNYSQDLNVVIDITALPVPSQPQFIPPSELSAATSTGSVNPTFRIESGQGRVELLRNGVVVASRTAGGLISDPGPLANGTYRYTTRATDTAGNVSAESAATELTVTNGGGYWMVGTDGGVFAFGDAGFFGSTGSMKLNSPIVAMASTPSKDGYWILGQDGGVFAFGKAGFYGSAGSMKLNSPIKGMASSKTGKGYWLFAQDGGVFAFGDAAFLGSGSGAATSPIVAMVRTPDGNGYWLVGQNGQVLAYGSAASLTGLETMKLNAPIVGAAATGTGRGLWLVGGDGGVFGVGDAKFYGSTGGMRLNTPILGMASLPTGDGYYLFAGDGGVFNFGKAALHGSLGGTRLNKPVVGMAVN